MVNHLKDVVTIDVDRLKALRDAHQYSISDLSIRLGYKTPSGYWLIEKGERKVTINILYLLAQIYNCNMEDLLKQAN